MNFEKKQSFNIDQTSPKKEQLEDVDIENLWNEIKDKIDYSLFKYDGEKKPEMFKEEDWHENIKNKLPIMNQDENPISVFNKQIMVNIISNNDAFRQLCVDALNKRIKNNIQDFLPLGVALYNLKGGNKDGCYPDFYNEEEMEKYIEQEILNNPENLERFKFILENYIRAETYLSRYLKIEKYLVTHGMGVIKKGKFLDVGSSSGEAILPLTILPRLKLYALDKLPPKECLASEGLMAESFFDNELCNELIPKKVMGMIKHLQKKSVNKIKRVQGDALNLPFKSESMNVVNFSYIFCHMNEESCKKSLSEACRVLKENGYIFIQPVNKEDKDEPVNDEKILILRKKNGKIVLDKYI